jgi:hypothetical protein
LWRRERWTDRERERREMKEKNGIRKEMNNEEKGCKNTNGRKTKGNKKTKPTSYGGIGYISRRKKRGGNN